MPNVDVSSAISQITPVGAWRDGNQTHVRVWAPEHAAMELVLEGGSGRDVRPLARDARGYWSGRFDDVQPGAVYRYRLSGDDNQVFPDPASRFQPEGVHGPSQVIDPAFRWTDQDFRAPGADHLVFYELHVGTFSPEGTFRGVMERLPYIAQLGVTAIELMPVGDFSGDRNWGYDGVAIFAPARCYGTPDDLRRLVNAAHQHGLAVFLDVVYNHFGPDGAYANAFSPYYFTDKHRSPWGDGVNLDGPHSAEVRNFFMANALQWIREYHIDGLRLDATHALQDEGPRHFLEEFTTTVRGLANREVLFVAEDHRNLAQLVQPVEGGGWGIDGVWADDLHHQVRVHVAHDSEGYYEDFSGRAEDLATTIRQGWFFTGQRSKHMKEYRGTNPSVLAPRQFVVCIQNHDQVGNRAEGHRLTHDVDLPVYRAVSALLLTIPETPLLFMGQEWAAASPFLFFTDHNEELGRQVTKGRREEFASFKAFADPALRARIPDPQAEESFDRSRLQWNELDAPPHASTLRLYQRLLGLRATSAALRNGDREAFDARALDDETLVIERRAGTDRVIVVVRLLGGGTATLSGVRGAQVMLTTEDSDLAHDPQPITVAMHEDTAEVRFARPGAVLLHGR